MAVTVSEHIAESYPAKAEPISAVDRALNRGAARVTGINQTTRDAIAAIIAQAIEDGTDLLAVADSIEGLNLFDEYRSELIARTELMDAYNGAAIGAYGDAGFTMLEAIDGDGDEECASRDGQEFSVEEADSIEDHPNGTLDWVPVMDKAAPVKAEQVRDDLFVARAQALLALVPDAEPDAPFTVEIEHDEHGRVRFIREVH